MTFPNSDYDCIESAYCFQSVLLHELGHVLDYQRELHGEKLHWQYYTNTTNVRAMKHDLRPQEIRADQYRNNALKQIKADNEVLELAIWLESRKIT